MSDTDRPGIGRVLTGIPSLDVALNGGLLDNGACLEGVVYNVQGRPVAGGTACPAGAGGSAPGLT